MNQEWRLRFQLMKLGGELRGRCLRSIQRQSRRSSRPAAAPPWRPPFQGGKVVTEIKYPTRLLDRAFSILELLSTRSKPLSLAEISAEAELDKATAYRILTNLVRRNYVHRNEDTKAYTL